MKEKMTIVKRDPQGVETWRYSGVVLRREPQGLLIEAFFNRPDLAFHGITLGKGDRFVEAYFCHRWYNIFEIHDRETDEIKGWYCNITRPTIFSDEQIDYVDLALDLLVYPDGRTLLLDEDEFDALSLSARERKNALAAAGELEEIFKQNPGKPLDLLFGELASLPPALPI
jgi:hypothetical protein